MRSGNEIDRRVPPALEPGVGQRRGRAMLRELDLPYVALNPGASYRGLHDSLVNCSATAAAHAAVPARGARGRDRARLCQGHRQADGRDRAQQCRADARDDGDLQRLVRPRAGVRARRHRAGRRGQAPAVDRLDPHRAGPGRAGPQLHQMGRPAGLGRGGGGVGVARLPHGDDAAARARSISASTRPCRRAGSARCRHCRAPTLSRRRAPAAPDPAALPRPPRCWQAPSGR